MSISHLKCLIWEIDNPNQMQNMFLVPGMILNGSRKHYYRPARPLPMVKDSFLFFTRDLLDHCRWIMTKHNLNRLLPYKVHQQALIRRNPPFDLNPIILYSQVAWFQDFFPRQFGAQRLLFGYLPSFHNWRLSNIKTKGCLVFLKVLYQIFQATHIWAVIALTSILSAGAHATRGNSTQLQSF